MQIFLDTADLDEIRRWLACGLLDGVTTNPSIMLRDGAYDTEGRAKEIARLVGPRPVSVEVTSNDPAEMLGQAHDIASWAPNIVVKIPVINQDGLPCLGVVRELETAGVRVNVTACLSYGLRTPTWSTSWATGATVIRCGRTWKTIWASASWGALPSSST